MQASVRGHRKPISLAETSHAPPPRAAEALVADKTNLPTLFTYRLSSFVDRYKLPAGLGVVEIQQFFQGISDEAWMTFVSFGSRLQMMV
jgi:hypothetical protein